MSIVENAGFIVRLREFDDERWEIDQIGNSIGRLWLHD